MRRFIGAFGSHSIRKQRGGQVAVAGVREQGHDGLSRVFGPLGQLNCRVERSPASFSMRLSFSKGVLPINWSADV